MTDNAQPHEMNGEHGAAARLADPATSIGDKEQTERRLSLRRRALQALQGSLADIPFSSDDFASMKQEEIDREERIVAHRYLTHVRSSSSCAMNPAATSSEKVSRTSRQHSLHMR